MNNLTILIPSHLKKLKILDFILRESKNFKVILVSNKKFKNKYSNVKYIKTSYINVIDKINHGLSYIKTDNILLLPDDELPIFSSIIHIYNQYKKNKKISSAIGLKYYFNYFNPKVFFPINHHSFDFYNETGSKNNKIEESLKFYNECFWGFHRTMLLKKFIKSLKNNKFINNYFMEYKIILFMKIFGNIKYYKFPWSFRIKTKKKWPNINQCCNIHNYKSIFKKDFESLTKYFCKVKKVKGDKKEIFYSALRNFIITQRPQDSLKNLAGLKKLVFLLKKIIYIFLFQKKYHMIPQLVDLYYVKYFDKKNFLNLYKKKYVDEYCKIINFVSKNNILKTYL
jgi:hypothetical protein